MNGMAMNTHLRMGHHISDSHQRKYYVEICMQQQYTPVENQYKIALVPPPHILYTPQVSVTTPKEEEAIIGLLLLDAPRNSVYHH